MNRPWQVFEVTPQMKTKVSELLRVKEKIFSLKSDPHLASLITCLGLQFEIGRPEWDRMSLALGIELNRSKSNPWQTQIISDQGEIGIRFWIPEVREFIPRHPDLKFILHPLSLDDEGRLNQIVIFPLQIARVFEKQGLELVIVKDWVMSSILSPDAENPVQYLQTNQWEIENNTAQIQLELVTNNQISFSGTHDLADHLLGWNLTGFKANLQLISEAQKFFETIFVRAPKNRNLLTSYFIGVVLDDLAQPIWYHSKSHLLALKKAIEFFKLSAQFSHDHLDRTLPQSFHKLFFNIRKHQPDLAAIESSLLQYFTLQLIPET